jgi:hypothetical protein
VLAEEIILLPNGRIGGYTNDNEHAWSVREGKLLFLTRSGNPSCIFTPVPKENTSRSFIGNFLLGEATVAHRLDEVGIVPERMKRLPEVLQFRGEFGEEINHFLPYIHWLYRTGALRHRKIETYPGMEPFYFFLHPSQILINHQKRHYVPEIHAPAHYLNPSGLFAVKTGCEWPPDYRAHYKFDFGFSKPILVIHNKYTEEWGGPPVNYFDLDVLDTLFMALKDRYQIIFFEAARASQGARGYSLDHQSVVEYADIDVAYRHREVIIFGDLLGKSPDSYNLLKLKIFSNCYHFITVQGGNAHLCSLFGGSLVAIQHKVGSEESHTYQRGIFQFLSNPTPLYLIGRDGPTILNICKAFDDCNMIAGRVQLGPIGAGLYQRFSPDTWNTVDPR